MRGPGTGEVRAGEAKSGELTRFGVSMSEDLLEKFDRLAARKGYANRSEAIRDLIRNELVQAEWEESQGEVVGTVTLVYDHHARGLSDALIDVQHHYHGLIISSLHVHLDEDHCLEVLVIRGEPRIAREVADRLISMKGVKHGKLTMTSTGRGLGS